MGTNGIATRGRRVLAVAGALMAVVGLTAGGNADASSDAGPAPLDEPTVMGAGISGSDVVMTACPQGHVSGWDDMANRFGCSPLDAPIPAGTVVLAIDRPCPVTTDLEGAFSSSAEMATMIECILPFATQWLSWEYSGLDVPAGWQAGATSLLPNNFLFVPHGVSVEGGFAHCGGYDSNSALHYCPSDGNIYFGEDQMWSDYNDNGDADLWGSVAHEMGHRVQQVAGFHLAATDNERIPAENQADCFSGAFLDYAARYGVLTADGDDLLDSFVGLFRIGEQVSVDQSHGTVDQRIRAFFVGYNAPDHLGVFACASYVTDVSIVPAA